MSGHNPAEKDFLGCGLGTHCACVNAFLPGPEERTIRKIELAKLAGVPTPNAPSSAHVSHLESFVEQGLIEKHPERDGLKGAFFRLTHAGAAKKAKHTTRPASSSSNRT